MRVSSPLIFVMLPLAALLSVAAPLLAGPRAKSAVGENAPGPLPRIFLLDAGRLAAVREEVSSGNRAFAPAYRVLIEEADRAFLRGPFSVTEKSITPPSGDRRDYLSQAPYWWPNPDSPDGLPYVRKDGRRNPEISKITDSRNLSDLVRTVQTLAFAAYLSGEERYALWAYVLLHVFFVDEERRMNPNVNFGQYIPGIGRGRAAGIIETRLLPDVVDAFGLLSSVAQPPPLLREGLRRWFSLYLDWLSSSELGIKEGKARNNHGTWYDAQIVPIALFLDENERAIRVLSGSVKQRIAAQIEPDGRQPMELARTNAWSYSLFNLEAFFRLAAAGERAGVNLWECTTAEGRGIRTALDFIAPFASGEKPWPYDQIGSWGKERLFVLFRQAAVAYRQRGYADLASLLAPSNQEGHRVNLVFPPLGMP